MSTNYQELSPAEVPAVVAECAAAWQDPAIPKRQYELAVKPEIEAFAKGIASVPFDALVKILRKLPVGFLASRPRLLDVGASCGYYRSVLDIAGFDFRYRGIDFSEAFRALAVSLYPGIRFDVGNACDLPYSDDSFAVVLHGACIMHIADYRKAIAEAARVSNRYVIFHRTPVTDGPTRFWRKEAYGVPCLEIHFNEAELLALFATNGLDLMHTGEVFRNDELAHKTFLLEKRQQPEPYASCKQV